MTFITADLVSKDMHIFLVIAWHKLRMESVSCITLLLIQTVTLLLFVHAFTSVISATSGRQLMRTPSKAEPTPELV